MKVKWIVKRLDGSKLDIETEEKSKPVPGDGKILNGIRVAVGPMVTTPNLADQGKHALVVEATEQKL